MAAAIKGRWSMEFFGEVYQPPSPQEIVLEAWKVKFLPNPTDIWWEMTLEPTHFDSNYVSPRFFEAHCYLESL